jgi:uncharacterized protein (DUF342 family)
MGDVMNVSEDFELKATENVFLTADYLIANPIDHKLKIKDVKIVQVKDTSKLALLFEDYPKQLIMNNVNKDALRKRFGKRPNSWINHEIQLVIEDIRTLDKRIVKGIRISE